MPNVMTPEEFEAAVKRLTVEDDTEKSHAMADRLMCDLLKGLGYGAGIAVYNSMDKWYA